MYKYMAKDKMFIVCYIYMETEASHRQYDFIIIHANNFNEAKEIGYRTIIKGCWMAQIIAMRLLSEVISQQDYFKLQKEKYY